MTIEEHRLSKQDSESNRKPIILELSLKHWYGVKKSNYSATLTRFIFEGAIITTQLKLKVGQNVHLTILSEHHTIRQLPAEVIHIEEDQANYRYGLRFNFSKFPEVARKNIQFILQQIENS